MRKQYLIGDSLWLLLGMAVCVESWNLKIGTFQTPGPGFLPFGAGLLLSTFSLVSLLRTAYSETIAEEPSLWTGANVSKPALVLVALLLYVVLLDFLGFFPCTLLLLIFLFRAVEPYSWHTVLFASVFSLISVYAVFVFLMDVRLPSGFLFSWP